MHQTAMNQSVDLENVRMKAYELWVTGGMRDGVAVQNWVEAERIVASTETKISTRTASPSAPPSAPSSAPPAKLDVSVTSKPNQKMPMNQNGRKR